MWRLWLPLATSLSSAAARVAFVLDLHFNDPSLYRNISLNFDVAIILR